MPAVRALQETQRMIRSEPNDRVKKSQRFLGAALQGTTLGDLYENIRIVQEGADDRVFFLLAFAHDRVDDRLNDVEINAFFLDRGQHRLHFPLSRVVHSRPKLLLPPSK